MVNIEVAFATSDKQICIQVKLKEVICVQEAIILSGILDQFSEIDLTKMKVGIFGKVCDLKKLVSQGDRVEIYRSLFINPMDARRKRAFKKPV